MSSKLVTDRQKSAAAVIAAARAHRAQAAAAIATALEPHLAKAETLPDVGLLLELCTRALESAIDTLVQADAAHEAELSDDVAPRRARDEASTALYEDMVELKEVATGLLGRAALEPLRLAGTTPRDPTVLVRHAKDVVEALQSATLPKSRVRGAKLHADEWAERLGEHIEPLSAALGDVAREAREAEATLVAKNRALTDHDRTFANVATLVSAVLRMSGETELAARVRPSPRRPGRTEEAVEGEGEGVVTTEAVETAEA